VHISLDGANPNATYNNRVGNDINDWGFRCGLDGADGFGWVHEASGVAGGPAAVDVPMAGSHTFRIWMREDGVKIDRFLLTTDPAFAFAPCDPGLPTHRDGPVLPTPVSFRHDGTNFVVEWLDPAYRLQSTTNLGVNATWQDVQGIQSPYRIPDTRTGQEFYRLISP